MTSTSSSTNRRYRFLPWVRRGLSRRIAEAENVALTPSVGRASIAIEVDVTSNHDSQRVAQDIDLFGPGDVSGLDTRAIIGHSPVANASDFEPNLFPTIEFADPALPWMMTPVSADADQRLRPWLTLVVVERDKCEVYLGKRLQTLEVKDSLLPDLSQSHLWAHAQVVADEEHSEPDLNASPALGLSRLICPIQLIPETEYRAFVVPTFEAGRLAGLGDEVTSTDGFAWSTPTTPAGAPAPAEGSTVVLPVYYQWEFSTLPGGDFEHLARLLGSTRLEGTDVGHTSMYVGRSDAALHANPPDDIVGFFGALVDPQAIPRDANDSYRDQLTEILDEPRKSLATGPSSSTVLAERAAPPIYGSWHVQEHQILDGSQEPKWVRELNLEPRNRAAAGLGAEIVRRNQEKLMDEAWAKVGEVLEANRALNSSELAKRSGERLVSRAISARNPVAVMQLLGGLEVDAAIQGRAHALLAISGLPNEIGSTNFRRMLAARSTQIRAVRRHQKQHGTEAAASIYPALLQQSQDNAEAKRPLVRATEAKINELIAETERSEAILPEVKELLLSTLANTRQATSAPDKKQATSAEPTGEPAARRMEQRTHVGAQAAGPETTTRLHRYFDGVQGTQAANLAAITIAVDGDFAPNLHVGMAGEVDPSATLSLRVLQENGEAVRGGTWTGTFGNLAKHGLIDSGQLQLDLDNLPTDEPLSKYSTGSLVDVIREQGRLDVIATAGADLASAALEYLPNKDASAPAEPAARRGRQHVELKEVPTQMVDPSELKAQFLSAINIEAQQRRALDHEFSVDGAPFHQMIEASATLQFSKNHDAVRGYPQLDSFPLFPLLTAYDQELFMPGVGDVPENSVGVLDVNQEFVEALLVGANHEMNRELLWRGYPTDRRGTPFKNFWEHLPTDDSTDPGSDFDTGIAEHTSGGLGTHVKGGDDNVVALVMRGELFQRYPNLLVYAIKSNHVPTDNSSVVVDVANDGLLPVFMGRLKPDITFLGFELSLDQLAPKDGESEWVFVLEEHFASPRFGLDITADSGSVDQAWDSVVVGPTGHLDASSLSVGGTIPIVSPQNSAEAAASSHQRPFRALIQAKNIVEGNTQ